jgi:PAS domain S-box-containing protein
MLPQKSSPPPSPQHPSIDLRLCLLNLPTPVIAVCQSRTVVFTNRAAEKLLKHEDHIQPHPGLVGPQLADFDITLLNNTTWDNVFDKFISAQESSSHGSTDKIPEKDIIVYEVEAVVEKPGKRDPQRFRILVSSLMGDDGMNYILSFEHSPHVGIKLTPGVVSWDRKVSTTALENKPKAGELHDEQRYKIAIFDSSRMAAFIIGSDEKSYILNRKLRVLLRHSIGDPQDQDDLNVSTWMDLWDERFTRRMREEELPGFRLIRVKKPYRDCCYGLTGLSKDKNKMFIVNISGECLYDDGGNFIGGVCWFTRFQNLPEYWAAEKERGLRSYESICNRLPHMAWTITPNGEADWFSQRWYEYTGMTEDEAAGPGFLKAFHPDDRAKVISQIEANNVTKEDYHIEFRFRRHDGCYRWLLARACPIVDENGKILRWYGSNTDIHDATVARLHADSIKDQIMAVLAHADVSLFAINRNKQVTMAEGGALGIVGRIKDRYETGLVGSNVIDLARSCNDAGSASKYISILK